MTTNKTNRYHTWKKGMLVACRYLQKIVRLGSGMQRNSCPVVSQERTLLLSIIENWCEQIKPNAYQVKGLLTLVILDLYFVHN